MQAMQVPASPLPPMTEVNSRHARAGYNPQP
jgi:hypothetical protein